MAKLLFSTVPINLKIGEKRKYRLIPHHNGQVGEKTFKNRVARRCGYDDVVVGCAMDGCGSQLSEELANGNSVDLGWGRVYLTAQGSAESANEPWNASKHKLVTTIVAKGTLKTCLEGMEMVNVTVGATVTIQHVADTVTQTDGTISGTTDVDVRVTGNGLAVDPDSEDEGVWLEDSKGIILAVATVTEATTTALSCRFATLPPDGTYTLVVASRGGLGAAFGVSTGTRKVSVRNASAELGEVLP